MKRDFISCPNESDARLWTQSVRYDTRHVMAYMVHSYCNMSFMIGRTRKIAVVDRHVGKSVWNDRSHP